ncbi:MAG: hypothetical protein ABJI60_20420 [Kangiellaceae bacterium]|jgi:hypothetical protein
MNKETLRTSLSKWTFEFFLIVIGVTIALWLENIAEENKERQIEQEYMLSFQGDVSKDIVRLQNNIKNNSEIVKQVEAFLGKMMKGEITEENLLSEVGSMMHYDYFSPDDFTLSSIKASGDFRLLRDPLVKRKILQLRRAYDEIDVLQQNFQKALDSQIVPMFIENIDMTRGKVINPDFIRDHRLANIAGYTISDLNGRIAWYRKTLKIAQSLDQLLIAKTYVE